MVRFATDAEPLFTGNCHCTDCQKSTGGPYTPAMFFPDSAVTVTGATNSFRSQGDSGKYIERCFCPNCGSPVVTKLETAPGMVGLKAGTLDDPSLYKPVVDIYVASAPHWNHMNPSLPKFDKSPPH
jgi:hypothetical protein